MLTHGSLFAGIGGFDLGFQWAGIETVWEVEIDEYCRKVLARHFPDAVQHGDIREVHGTKFHVSDSRSDGFRSRTSGDMEHNRIQSTQRSLEKGQVPKEMARSCCLPYVGIISGGFPCQDISVAGKQAGIQGSRSGLWSEMHRIISELRPQYAVIENVPNLARLGLDRVLADLASIGYDAEWQCISANDVGAPHLRKRIWIVAYPSDIRRDSRGFKGEGIRRENSPCDEIRGRDSKMADTSSEGLETQGLQRATPGSAEYWSIEPNVGRVAHGIPKRVDRLKGLGNSIVPQIAEIIGRLL